MNPNQSIEAPEAQFARLFEALHSTAGIFFVLCALVILTVLASGRRGRWGLLALLLFFSPMMIAIAPELIYKPVIAPFHQFRLYGRPICGALLVFMLVPAFRTQRGWRRRIIFFPALMYLLFELVFSLHLITGGLALRGCVSVIIYLVTFAVFGIGLPRWLQDLYDVRACLRAIAVTALLTIVTILIQVAFNPSALATQGRLYGFTGNAQQIGMVLGASFPVIAALCIWKGESKSLRILWVSVAAVMAVLLAWTGSRTGAMMALIGLGILFRRHLGAFFGFAVVCAILVLVALQIFSLDTKSSLRLLDTTNTRVEVWTRMLGDFTSNPMLGIPASEAYGSENSYLLVAARMGIVGLLPLFVLLGAWCTCLLRLYGVRKRLREQSLLVDLVLGGLVSFLIGAVFEGFLVGTLTHQVFLIYIYLAILAFLLDVADAQVAMAGQVTEEYGEQHEYVEPHLAEDMASF
jgi:hypothetical protein